MQKLGRLLRETREARHVGLEEAADATRIRAEFLELLEAGDFAALPGGDVQIRGFLRIYARYLDLSADDVLSLYRPADHGVAAPPIETIPVDGQRDSAAPPDDLTSIRFRPRDIPVASSLPRWMSLETVVILGIILTLLLVTLAIVTYVVNQPESGQSAPSVAPGALFAVSAPPCLSGAAGTEFALTLEAIERGLSGLWRGTSLVWEEIRKPDQISMAASDDGGDVLTGNERGWPTPVSPRAGEPMDRSEGASIQVRPPTARRGPH